MTPQMAACLQAIRDLTIGGVSPSYAELAARLGLSSSKSGISRLVNRLKDRGLITFQYGCARSIQIIEPVAPTKPLSEMSSNDLQTLGRQVDMVLAERRLNARRVA